MYEGKHVNKGVKKLFVIAGGIALATGMPAGVIAAPMVYKTIKNIANDEELTENDEFTDLCINRVTSIVDDYVKRCEDKRIEKITSEPDYERGSYVNGVFDSEVRMYQGDQNVEQTFHRNGGVSNKDYARYVNPSNERKESYMQMVRELEEEENKKRHGNR